MRGLNHLYIGKVGGLRQEPRLPKPVNCRAESRPPEVPMLALLLEMRPHLAGEQLQ